MLPLKQKTIWEKKLEDVEKNTLLVRVEKEVLISGNEVTPIQRTGTIEILFSCRRSSRTAGKESPQTQYDCGCFNGSISQTQGQLFHQRNGNLGSDL